MKSYLKLILGISVMVFIPDLVFSQSFLKAVNPDDLNGNFIELSREINMFYDTTKASPEEIQGESNEGDYEQWKRWEWFAMYHLDDQHQIVNYEEKDILAMEELNSLESKDSRSHTGSWYNLGHASIPGALASQGRVNSVAFDPVNGAIIYLASAGGGMWKSINNGDSWTNLDIDLPNLGIADIVVSPAPNNNVVYALSGDLSGGANIYVHNSLGVIKSYNGGLTWTRTNFSPPATQDLRGYKLLMDPNNPNTLLAAMSDGIHRTNDGGNTWTLTFARGNINDMEFSLSNLDTVFYTTRNSNYLSKLSLSSGFTSSVYITTSMNVDRMEIAVTPDNPSAVYLLAGPGYNFFGGNLFNGLFYSNNSGASFTLRTVVCNNNGDLFNSAASFAWYANTIYVDPLEENYVIVGGLNLFNSVDGGVTLNQVTFNTIHADQHNIKRNPLNGNLWLCNDGGVYRSSTNGNTWENKSNGLTINEYYRISGTNNGADRLLGGAQDNGQFLRTAPGVFASVLGGDGLDNYFNSYDNSIAYACTQNGGLARSTNFGAGFSDTNLPNAGDNNSYPWITPIVQHPPYFNAGTNQWEDKDVIYVYSLTGIMRSSDGGGTWTNIGPMGLGELGTGPSMVMARDNGGYSLYVANGNKFWVCFNPLTAAPIWNNNTLPIGNSVYISAIAVNPARRGEVMAVISGYQAGTKVFRTQDGGGSWNNLSLSLPNSPVYSIVFANNVNSPSGAVYVGSEIGVFYTDDGIPDWVPYTNQLPHVPVTDLEINYVTGKLKAATYGRGIWESDLYEICPSSVHINYDINQGQYNFEASTIIYAYGAIGGGIGSRVTMKSGGQIRLQNGFRAYQDSYVKLAIGNCGTGILGLAEHPSKPDAIIESVKVTKGNAERN